MPKLLPLQEVTVTAVSADTKYYLNNVCGWTLSAYDGLGIAEINRITQRSPGQDGDTDIGYRRAPRFITLRWWLQGARSRDVWNLRETILGIFRPRVNDPVRLTFTLPNDMRVSADVNLEGLLDPLTADRLDGKTQAATAVLRAADPRLYNPIRQSLVFSILDGYTGWDIEEIGASSPYANDTGWDVNPAGAFFSGSGWNIGASNLYIVTPINYAQGAINSDVEYPVIRLNGQISSPVITNLTTGESLPFTNGAGLVLGVGEWVEIDLNFAAKTVLNNSGADVSQYLTSDNDLATFHLAYNSEMLPNGTRSTGVNVISVSGDNVIPSTSIEIYWYERFIGV